jgi:hypothetical protein
MAGRHRHHFFHDLNGVFRPAVQAYRNDPVHSARVTFIADKMTVHTSCFTVLLFMAKLALHRFVCFKVFKRRFADQTFFIHSDYLGKKS